MNHKMSLEGRALPPPPKFPGSEISIGPFYHCDHPYTKWMLNMLRGGASFRISTMIKERPELFKQIYQIPDCPDIVRNESYDTTSMFNRHTILFLNPLCLAIYMKKDKSAELILKSGLNKSNQKCWACEIFSRSQVGGGDLLEIYPIFIAIRREYFEVIPLLVHCFPNLESLPDYKRLDVTERIDVRYESRELKKIYHYRDVLQYAIDTLKRRGNLPLFRLLELFIIDCPNFFNPTRLEKDKDGNLTSLFYRLAHVAYFEDPDCRIIMQLIQCLEVLLKHKCVPWNSFIPENNCNQGSSHNTSVLDNGIVIKDHNACVALLLAIYNQIQVRIKNGPLDNLGYLIIKTLQQTQLRDRFLAMTPEQIQYRFGKISSHILVPLEATCIIKRHIQAILELEKERELKTNMNSKFKGVAFLNRNHRRSCSLKEHCEETGYRNLLQARNVTQNSQGVVNKSPSPIKTLKHYTDHVAEETLPIYTYQTGSSNCYTQTTSSPTKINLDVYENECPNSFNEPSTKLNQYKCNIIPGLTKKSKMLSVQSQEIDEIIFQDPTEDNSESSASSHTANCLEMTPMRYYGKMSDDSKQHNVCANGDDCGMFNHVLRSNNNSNQSDTSHTNYLLSQQSAADSKSELNALNNFDFNNESLLFNNDDDYDLSAEFSDNNRIIEFEDELFKELFIEYNDEHGEHQCNFNSKDKVLNIRDTQFISKINNDQYVDKAIANFSKKNIFSRM